MNILPSPYADMMSSVKSGKLFASLESGFTDIASHTDSMTSMIDGLKPSIPGFDLDLSATTNRLMGSMTSVTSGIVGQCKNLGTNIPLMLSADNQNSFVARTDSVVNGLKTNIISESFPGTQSSVPGVSGDGCMSMNFASAFAPIMQGPKLISDTINSLKSHIQSVMAQVQGFATTVSGLISGVVGSIQSSVQVLINSAMSSLKSAISPITDAIHGAVDGMRSTFKGMVDSAKAAINDAIDTIKAGSFLRLFNSNHPCVSKVMNVVAGAGKIDPKAVFVAKTQDQILQPEKEAVAQVQSGQLPPINPNDQLKLQPINPQDVIQYSTSELAGMQAKVDDAIKSVQDASRASAEWYKVNIEDWKISVNFATLDDASLRQQAGSFMPGKEQPMSKEDAAAWKTIYAEYLKKRTEYDVQYFQPMQAKIKYQWALQEELMIRTYYGKTPYTTLKAKQGIETIHGGPPTTFLDSGY